MQGLVLYLCSALKGHSSSWAHSAEPFPTRAWFPLCKKGLRAR